MKKAIIAGSSACVIGATVAGLLGCASSGSRSHAAGEHTVATTTQPATQPKETSSMQLGNFSVSLAVKDIAASRAFYEKLGFRTFGGDQAQGWLILQNETSTIGLFQGMFDKNMLTFNPGWDRSAKTLPNFDDVRDLQKSLKQKGITFTAQADESSAGPASFMIVDPDGNPILIDQHVPRTKK